LCMNARGTNQNCNGKQRQAREKKGATEESAVSWVLVKADSSLHKTVRSAKDALRSE